LILTLSLSWKLVFPRGGPPRSQGIRESPLFSKNPLGSGPRGGGLGQETSHPVVQLRLELDGRVLRCLALGRGDDRDCPWLVNAGLAKTSRKGGPGAQVPNQAGLTTVNYFEFGGQLVGHPPLRGPKTVPIHPPPPLSWTPRGRSRPSSTEIVGP